MGVWLAKGRMVPRGARRSWRRQCQREMEACALALFFYWGGANRTWEQKRSFYFPSSCLPIVYRLRKPARCQVQGSAGNVVCGLRALAPWSGCKRMDVKPRDTVYPEAGPLPDVPASEFSLTSTAPSSLNAARWKAKFSENHSLRCMNSWLLSCNHRKDTCNLNCARHLQINPLLLEF